ncbi:MAG TPA: ABC transporter ATP-binding protein [Tepidisphaeraceae bacterium]|jgi:ATP-binding cassette subfamily B protein/subfamily B ATP-binding cassette protein MsbA|nr:ABC transporter ATP-binding protein [Tepidisphaeraceae bacterium]
MKTSDPPAKQNRQYRRLLGYARPYARQWCGMALIMLASSAVAIAQPWPMQVLADHVLDDLPMPPMLVRLVHLLPAATSKSGLLAWVGISTLLFYALASLIDAALTYGWILIGQRMVYDVARDLFSITQRQSLRFHAKHPVGDSMSRIMTDSWCVNNVVESLLLTPGQAIITTASIVLLMFHMNVELAVASVIVAPIISLASRHFAKRMRKIAKARREIESGMQAHVQQVLSGIHVVQAFGQEVREHERFAENAGQAIRAFRRGVLVTNLSNLYTGLILTMGTGVVLYVGARQVIAGSLSVGTLLVFLGYLNTLQNQVWTLTRTYSSLQSRRAEIDRVTEYLTTPNDIVDSPNAVAMPKARGEVSIEDVSFGYEMDRPVLSDVTLELHAGQTIALVGPTGAGKSTLASLLPRFFDPWKGCVRIDGRDVREFRVRDLRQQVSLVLQESFLFPISIAENIAFGKPGAARREIERAGELANAAEFITQLPDGYDTIIGERGATLSGGQKQRLSIARALLKNSPILILDEPTAALDTITEQAILEAMRRLMSGRTTLIIAHRLSTIRDADQIAVLEAGRIVELGTHEELVRRRGLYARFSNVQNAPAGV